MSEQVDRDRIVAGTLRSLANAISDAVEPIRMAAGQLRDLADQLEPKVRAEVEP